MAKILLIEDDFAVGESIALALRAKGHNVVTAEDGRTGLRKFERAAFDLVITDLIMPEQEGIETIRLIRRLSRDMKIIAISGGGRHANFSALRMAQRLGATTTLAKPFTLDALYQQVDKTLLGGKP
jgi:DNA-binding NtrC family response regulator